MRQLLTLLLGLVVLGCSSNVKKENLPDSSPDFQVSEVRDETGDGVDLIETSQQDLVEADQALDDTDDPDQEVEELCGPGGVTGRVCAPNGFEWIAGAQVRLSGLDCDGVPFEEKTTTNHRGEFTFSEVPAGQHDLSISKGSFETQFSLMVRPGQTTDMSAGTSKTCLIDASVRIAIVSGSWDSIQEIVDGMGLDFDFFGEHGSPSAAGTLLNDVEALSTYDIVMINCGEHYFLLGGETEEERRESQAQMGQALRTFVDNGGSLYVSDWAHFFLGLAYPQVMEMYQTGETYQDTLIGPEGDLQASIIDPQLIDIMGADTLSIHFPISGWALARATRGTPMVEGEIDFGSGETLTAPLLFTYQPQASSGTVFFTSFHNEDQLSEDIESLLQHIIFSL